MKAGIAIGRHTHELVLVDGENVTRQYISNDSAGVEKTCKILTTYGIPSPLFLGNFRWGLPFVSALKSRGIESFRFRLQTERGKRGKAGNITSMLIKVMQRGINPRPYFRQETSGNQPKSMQEIELPTSYRISIEYLDAADKIRQLKHHLLDCLTILFPEAVKAKTTQTKGADGNYIDLPLPEPQPPCIFTKKMERIFANPDPMALENDKDIPASVRALAKNSLGRFVPKDICEKTKKDYNEYILQYRSLVKTKKDKLDELHKKVAENPLYVRFGRGDIIAVISGFLGWREWPNWRELRRFCGLDVSRIDASGKHRISRVRPEIRMYLYLFATLTKKGKEVTSATKRRVKKLERLLKHFWRECLKGQPVTVH